ncbi:MAG: hypothetical protein COZ34_04650 [Candidatus Pacebacteria bacterium CG_4_10_14_3_um_filter_34_15]|nr:hypothetical protein [Candidatus Paceibacterota bacterium]OIO43978.1 MAG: hypothetical protein AUJ41_03985 [Candidatus Pacebacteria bacterium CG1_02_43_31]PIX81186.1 MAG: hypothetical protein COZ34_04650 [Candidatus Pacebacteria bacterium CG_4_10_14_3_um_filter_34_15]PJC43514.1 MAG: hypothetical protein CO039_03675 [Candidatus Pacebacteria bacterium CG_4_9_14_0_2_um_filter_34_50]
MKSRVPKNLGFVYDLENNKNMNKDQSRLSLMLEQAEEDTWQASKRKEEDKQVRRKEVSQKLRAVFVKDKKNESREQEKKRMEQASARAVLSTLLKEYRKPMDSAFEKKHEELIKKAFPNQN